MVPTAVLEVWRYAPEQSTQAVVLPDGCRDLICHVDHAGQTHFLVSDLVDSAYAVPCRAGEHFLGIRCRPGVQLDADRLLQAAQGYSLSDGREMLAALHDCARLSTSLDEALFALSQANQVQKATRMLGVSQRSLERLFARHDARTPHYWCALARVRRAARALSLSLSQATSLAELAVDAGFADQAHLGRAFKQWFGVSPTQLKADPVRLASACASGYG